MVSFFCFERCGIRYVLMRWKGGRRGHRPRGETQIKIFFTFYISHFTFYI